MADRFFCPDAPIDGRLNLGDDEAYHLARVRRVEPGEVVEIFDGQGGSFPTRVERITREGVELVVTGERVEEPGPPFSLTLATAAPKGDRFEWLVEKATEIGVARLVPLVTGRTVVVPGRGKLDRIRRRVIEACKQCGRNRLMTIEKPRPWLEFVREESAPARLVAHPGGLSARRWPRVATGQSATLAIGPEGGFGDDEIEAAAALGWQIASLGRTLLRIETAGLAGAATWLALREENEA